MSVAKGICRGRARETGWTSPKSCGLPLSQNPDVRLPSRQQRNFVEGLEQGARALGARFQR